jgi:hypothetical protein
VCSSARHRFLVEVDAEQIDAVRSGEIVEYVAVKVGNGYAGGRLQERAERQVLAYEAAVLERHPIGIGDLEIGHAVGHLRCRLECLGEAPLEIRRKPYEAGLTLCSDALRCIVRAKKFRFVIFVEWQKRCHAPRHARVPSQRFVLGLGQFQPPFELDQRRPPRRPRRSR